MKELWNTLARWAWQKKERRPFLLVFLIIPLFGFTQKHWGWTWNDTLTHWFLWRLSGAILIVSGILHAWMFPDPPGYPLRRRPLHPRFTCAVLAIAGGGLVYFSYPRPLPSCRLVVTIAQFMPISDSAREKAADISDRIKEMLRARVREGAPLDIKLINETVTGVDEKSQEIAAQELGKSWQGNSNVVVWGDVRNEENELFVTWHLTVARQLRTAPVEGRSGQFTDTQPEHVEAEERLSDGIADLVTLLYGLAYYKTEQWDRAIQMLGAVEAKQGQLYKSLSLIERSRESLNPPSDLQMAISTLDAVLGSNRLERITASMDQVTQAAILDRAIALALLAVYSQPKDSIALLEQAIGIFRDALPIVKQERGLESSTAVQKNLTVAIRRLAVAIGNSNVEKLLGQDTAAIQSVGEAFVDSENIQRWKEAADQCQDLSSTRPDAWASENCADIFIALEASIPGEAGEGLVRESIKARRAALARLSQGQYPQTWATWQQALGTSLLFLGIQGGTTDPEGNAGKAADAFRASLEVWTKDSCPVCWAQAESNLGWATSVQAYQRTGESAKRLAEEAIADCQSAQEVYSKTDFPAAWARIQAWIVGTRSWLGEFTGGRQGKELLQQAGREYDDFLPVHFATDPKEMDPLNPLMHGLLTLRANEGDPRDELLNDTIRAVSADVRYSVHSSSQSRQIYYLELGDALASTGFVKSVADNGGKAVLLRQAIAAYEDALHASTSRVDPQSSRAIQAKIRETRGRIRALSQSN